MAKNRISEKGRYQDYLNSTGNTITSGSPVIFDGVSRLGVVQDDIPNGETGVVDTQGIYELTKKTAGDNFSKGLSNFKLDSSRLLVLNGGTGSPDTAISNAYVTEANSTTTTVKIKLLG
jgi:predicted RecA/RadA family phage recombinase